MAIHELNNQMQSLSFQATILQNQIGKISSVDLAEQTHGLCETIQKFVALKENVQDMKRNQRNRLAG